MWGAIGLALMPDPAAARAGEIREILWHIAAPGYDVLVAWINGRIEGVSLTVPGDEHGEGTDDPINPELFDDSDCHVNNVCVVTLNIAKDQKNNGLGTGMMKTQMEGAKASGYKGMVGNTYKEAALKMLENLGWFIDDKSQPFKPWALISFGKKAEE